MKPSGNIHVFQFRYWFGQVDSRPVALFRVLLSLLLIKDAVYHLPLAGWFYSDDGILPRRIMLEVECCKRFSLMDALAHEWQVVIFFLIWIAVLFGLLVGYRTHMMAILNFILILSVHQRNTFVLSGADNLLRLMSFWLMFAPAGQHYALDALRRSRNADPDDQPRTMFALPLRMMQLQLLLVYTFTVYLKLIGDYWPDGEALYYILQLDSLLLPPGVWLRDLEADWLYRLITWYTVVIEITLPILLLAPITQPRLRKVGLLGGVLLHAGIAITLAIPDFSLVMLSAYVLFFEPEWIDTIRRRLKRIGIMINVMSGFSSIHPLLQRIADRLQSTTTAPQPHPTSHQKILLSGALIPLMLSAIWWNIEITWQYREHNLPPPPPLIDDIIHYAALWQAWDLFAPTPYLIEGRFLIEGYFEDDTLLDLKTRRAITDHVAPVRFGPGLRQSKYEEVLFDNPQDLLMMTWADYYCQHYNQATESPRLLSLQIQFIYRRSHAPNMPRRRLTIETLWEQSCE